MATGDFDAAYGLDPWSGLNTNERKWYDPLLRDIYRKKNVFGAFSNFRQNLGDRKARTMNITSLFDLHPNTDPIGFRDIWGTTSHFDSRQVEIQFNRYYGKVAYNEFDDIVTYWQSGQGGLGSAVRGIVNDKLGIHMTQVLDQLARNAFIKMPYTHYAGTTATNFNTLSQGDTMTTPVLDDIHLGMQFRDVPYAQSPDGTVDSIVCITTPGVYFDLQQQSNPRDWIGRMQYADPSRLLNYEVGSFRNVRFIVTPKATLFNCGALTYQATVSEAITAGDGAPDPASSKVDNTFLVGQSGSAAKHYIQLTGGSSNFAKDDIVTIHRTKGTTYGVTDGVLFDEGTLHNRRVVSVDTVNHRLAFDQPIMVDMTSTVESGVYAYVSKGRHIHSSIFLGGPDALVVGVGRPIEFHMPPVVDDFMSQRRFSWDGFLGYQNYNPICAEVVFSSGSYRGIGARIDG